MMGFYILAINSSKDVMSNYFIPDCILYLVAISVIQVYVF